MRWGLAVVRGRSMEPTLHEGDRVLVAYGRQARPGDLVVVRLPNRPGYSVKRVFRRDTNGWWVERDNRNEGVDSWLVGAIPDQDLLGVVRTRVWPLLRRRR
jgi:nickel-type superoxide dismutase maturation protease